MKKRVRNECELHNYHNNNVYLQPMNITRNKLYLRYYYTIKIRDISFNI